jgi:hypothetical protein
MEEFQPLPPLGTFYGQECYVNLPGEEAFEPSLDRTPEEARVAMRKPFPPNLETIAAALTRDEIDYSVVQEWSPFKVPDIQRGEWIMAMIRDHKTAMHTANKLLLNPALDWHCPRCTKIHDKHHRRFTTEECRVIREEGPIQGFKTCNYVYCSELPLHARRYCPKINLRRRGHAEEDNVCGATDANLTIFEEAADLGWVTENRFRPEGIFRSSPCRRFAMWTIWEVTQHYWQ